MTTPSRPRVLIVEDDPDLRSMTQDLLEDFGYEADTANNTDDALDLLKNDDQVGIVLLDLGLPPKPQDISEGMRFLHEARLWNSALKVIVMSGQDAEHAAIGAIREGAFDYAQKPVRAEALRTALERAELFIRNERKLRDRGIRTVTVTAQEGVKQVRDEAVERLVRTVLTETNFNVTEASRRLGMSRERTYYYINKFNLQRTEM